MANHEEADCPLAAADHHVWANELHDDKAQTKTNYPYLNMLSCAIFTSDMTRRLTAISALALLHHAILRHDPFDLEKGRESWRS